MKPQRETHKSLSFALRRSVPKLFLILTATIPAAAIPSFVVAKNSKQSSIKYIEGECLGSKINEPLSQSGRFAIGQKENPTRYTHLEGVDPGPAYLIEAAESAFAAVQQESMKTQAIDTESAVASEIEDASPSPIAALDHLEIQEINTDSRIEITFAETENLHESVSVIETENESIYVAETALEVSQELAAVSTCENLPKELALTELKNHPCQTKQLEKQDLVPDSYQAPRVPATPIDVEHKEPVQQVISKESVQQVLSNDAYEAPSTLPPDAIQSIPSNDRVEIPEPAALPDFTQPHQSEEDRLRIPTPPRPVQPLGENDTLPEMRSLSDLSLDSLDEPLFKQIGLDQIAAVSKESDTFPSQENLQQQSISQPEVPTPQEAHQPEQTVQPMQEAKESSKLPATTPAIEESSTPTSSQPAEKSSESPRSMLKMFPLRPENYQNSMKKQLEKTQTTTPQSQGTIPQPSIQNEPANVQVEKPAQEQPIQSAPVQEEITPKESTPIQPSTEEKLESKALPSLDKTPEILQKNQVINTPAISQPEKKVDVNPDWTSLEKDASKPTASDQLPVVTPSTQPETEIPTPASTKLPEIQPKDSTVDLTAPAKDSKATDLMTPATDALPPSKTIDSTTPVQDSPLPTKAIETAPPAKAIEAVPPTKAVETAPAKEAIPSAKAVETPALPTFSHTPSSNTNTNVQSAPESATAAAKPATEGYLTNYTNLNIKEYIRFISKIANKNFIFNEDDLNFSISMISEKRASAEELIATLMQQLRIHGLAVMEEGDNFIIHTNPEVSGPATVLPSSPGEKVPNDVQIVTQVFRLNVVDPSRAVTILKPLLSAQAVIEPLDEAGILTLTDLKVNVERVRDLLYQLDFPSAGLDVSHFHSDYVNADTLAALGEKILTPLADGKALRLIPLKDSNTVFIISTPIMVKRAVEFFQALDKEIRNNGGGSANFSGNQFNGNRGPNGSQTDQNKPQTAEERRKLSQALQEPLDELNQTLSTTTAAQAGNNTEFDYYKLEFRKGDQIQKALQQIGDSIIKAKADELNNDLYNAISSVQWIEASNTLLYTGTLKSNEKIRQLIKDLDTPNQQVLIEMLLLDTSIDKSYEFGVDWGTRFGGPNAGGSQAFLSPLSPLANTLDGIPQSEFLNAQNLARASGFSLGVIGRNISCGGLTFSTLGALVTAIHDTDIGKVVLNPKIVVEENNSAEIFVGLNVPFKTQSIANDFGTILTNNFEYRDIGARMKVTPIINKNGIITLEIEQELSTLVASTTSVITNSFFDDTAASGAGPTTRKSNSKTTVFVPNGHFVILSGMLQEETERERRQIPCLGGVPVLGGAFSQKRNREQNRNLMIFIRPSLINTEEEMTYFTKREQDMYDQKCREKDLWKYEIDEALDFLNIKQDPCHK